MVGDMLQNQVPLRVMEDNAAAVPCVSDGPSLIDRPPSDSTNRSSEESHENINVDQNLLSEDKSKSCKRKLDFILKPPQSIDEQDPEDKQPESPSPKRWVIGPLFQSFKSKMASFTEIVMSPARLFKPNDLEGQAAESSHGDSESQSSKGKDVCLNRGSLLRSPVVQRLSFNTEEIRAGVTPSEDQTPAIFEGGELEVNLELGSDSVGNSDFQTSDSPKNVSCPVSSPKKTSPVHKEGTEPRGLDGTERMDDTDVGSCVRKSGELRTGSVPRTRRQKSECTSQPTFGTVRDTYRIKNISTEEIKEPTAEPGTSRNTRQHKKRVLEARRNEDINKDEDSRPDALASSRKRRRNNVHQPKQTPAPLSKRLNTRGGRKVEDNYEDQGMSMSLTLKVGSGESPETEPLMSCGIVRIEAKMDDGTKSCRSKAVHEQFTSRDVYVPIDKDEEKTRRWYLTSDRSRPDISSRLKRSLSCPDISSLRPSNDLPSHLSPSRKSPHVHSCSPSKRERRHTVCSLEIEREIAPLCLRKEVYPNHGSVHSPSKSLAVLVSRFLSSPLAFLSKKSSGGWGDDSGYGTSSSDLGLRSSFLASPTSGPALLADVLQTPEQGSDPSCSSVFDPGPMEVVGLAQQENESTEKALSDSEIKTDSKQVERRKVSSIRIRKTLPKPQYNLTPMGLPKAVRIKKKVFSVEEIYTNKNFSKPPEGRLETIYEVPLSRRDGSECRVGQKRVKRFITFPELGVARKPKRPPVCSAGGGGAQRKAAGNPGAGRTRRGVWASAREEEALVPRDLDSLLCSKLSELDHWMVEQEVY